MKIKLFLFLILTVIISQAQTTIITGGGWVATGLSNAGTVGTVSCPAITQSGALPAGVVGTPYSTTLTASGGTLPYTWSLIGGNLPASLSANQVSNTYVISGTPSAIALSSFTVQVQDTSTCAPVTSSLTINVTASTALALQPASLPSVVQNTVYPATTLLATGGTTPYASCNFVSGAPTGLTITVTNVAPKGCILGGTVTAAAGSFPSVVARVVDNLGTSATQTYSITVLCTSCGAPTSYPARTDTLETLSFLGRPGDIPPTLWLTNANSPDWAASTAKLLNNYIYPTTNNTLKHVFRITQAGTTGLIGAQPNWDSICLTSCNDNTTKWIMAGTCTVMPCHRIGLNLQAVDPDFHTINIRASDAMSNCNGGGLGQGGPSGGDVPWISINSTKFLSMSSGGRPCLNYFDPLTRTITYSRIFGAPGAGSTTSFASGANMAFSGLIDNKMYEEYITKSSVVINTLSIDQATDTVQGRSQFRSLITGTPGAGPSCLDPSYATLTRAPWTGVFGPSSDDSIFTMGFSKLGQNTGFEIIVVNSNFPGCRKVTLEGVSRGAVGDFGCHYTAGDVTRTCTPDVAGVTYPLVTDLDDVCLPASHGLPSRTPCLLPDEFTLHGVSQTPNSNWAHLGATGSNCAPGKTCSCNGALQSDGGIGGCETYYLNPNSNLLEPCMNCSGHQDKGTKYEYRGNFLANIDYSNPSINRKANPGTKYIPNNFGTDFHGSGNNLDGNDSQPLMIFASDVKHTNTILGWQNRQAYATPWYAEITGISTQSFGTVYRLGLNYNTSLAQSFPIANAVGVVSTDGAWAIHGTDWMCNFGDLNGGNSPNLVGGPDYISNNTYNTNDEIGNSIVNISPSFIVLAPGGVSGSGKAPAQINAGPWKTKATLAVGTSFINPDTNNTGKNIFHVSAITTGITGTVEPNWDSVCATSCVDAGVTWSNDGTNVIDTLSPSSPQLTFRNEGRNTCAGDNVIKDLLSAH